MKKKLVTGLLIFALLVPAYLFSNSLKVAAQSGSANVYILALSDVPCHVFGYADSNDYKSNTVKGAIDAVNFHETGSLPLVHPKYGNDQPFYGATYSVITDWSTYESEVQYGSNIIIINAHGEILPIPSSFSPQSWMAVIAGAVLNRSVVWVHTAGYPFYWAWYQGQSQSSYWGESGFQNFTQYIGINSVSCDPPADETSLEPISSYSSAMLSQGWPNIGQAFYAELGRPLNSATFKNYTVYPLWGPSDGSCNVGAVVAFVKPGQRYAPTTHTGFGAYVHIGTRNVEDNSYHAPAEGSDYMRGYIGCAAALAVVVQRFNPVNADASFLEPSSDYSELGLIATPVISNWNSYVDTTNSSNSHWIADVDYAIYGCLKTNGTGVMNQIEFYVSSPYACQMRLNNAQSLSAHKDDSGTMLNIITTGALDTLDVIIILAPEPEPGSKLWALTQLLNGISLFRDIQDMTNIMQNILPQEGSPACNEANCTFQPDISESNTDGYTFYEFEASIRVQVEFGYGVNNTWNVLPLDFYTYSHWTTGSNDNHILSLCSGSDICYHSLNAKDAWQTHNTTIFFDHFNNDLGSWTAGDNNPDYGSDYWGIYTGYSGNSEPCVYCAEVGNNSLHGDVPDVNLGYYGLYDRGMDAVLSMPLDLSAYQAAWVRFNVLCWFGSATYLAVESYVNGGWALLKNYTVDYTGETRTLSLSTAATSFRFRFHSDDSSDGGGDAHQMGSGVWIDFVELIGQLPNDANSGSDAGDSVSGALLISPNSSYKGFLEYDPDTYNFTVTASDISNQRVINASISPQGNNIFTLALYNPLGTSKAGPSAVVTYTLSSGDVAGNWTLQIPHATEGFGQYRLDISVQGGGGGESCPFVSVWNGTSYVLDNNILPESEWSNGTDVTDYYTLEQTLVPKDGEYALMLSEFEHEQSLIDYAHLVAVDHRANVNVGVSPTGQVLTYKHPYPAVSAMTNDGMNVRQLLSKVDGNYYEGYNGSYVTLNFGRLDVSYGAKLVIVSDLIIIKCPIYIQTLDAHGNWRTVATIYTRNFWATDVIDLKSYLPEAGGRLMVRLCFVHNDTVDFVGLDTSPQARIDIHPGQLVSAISSVDGDVTASLVCPDKVYAELVPGENIQLAFNLPAQTMQARTYIIETEGYYCTMTS